MLFSLFLTYLLKRKFHGKTYGFLVVVSLASISFFSAGVPEHRAGEIAWPSGEIGVRVNYPLPLSFPVFSTLEFNDRQVRHTTTQWYQIHVLNFVIQEDWVFFGSTANLSWFEYALYLSFFMLVNIVGVLLGYWLSMRKSVLQSRVSAS